LYEEVAFSQEAQLRTLPGDAGQRLGLRFAAQPDADGLWRVRAGTLSHPRSRGEPESPAQAAGVQTGDVLLEVDGVRPATRAALEAALQAREDGAALPVVVRRAGAEIPLVLHPLALTGDNFWVYGPPDRAGRHGHHEQPDAQGTSTSRSLAA